MNSILLRDAVTDKDREDYIKTQVQRIVCLPFNPLIFADAKFWVEKLSGETRKRFMNLIWRWFYGCTGEFDEEGIGESDQDNTRQGIKKNIREEA